MKNDITYLGQIIRVDSGNVEVEVSNDIPSAAPIIKGRLYKIGQIGTFVKIPVGNIVIYGLVSSVSNVSSHSGEMQQVDIGSRFLSVQLVGEKVGDQEFEKGIGTYPTINDEVHLVTEDDLIDIYGEKDDSSIKIGNHSSSDNLSVYANIHKLILRHSAIFGSTGSGKSNTTVSILKSILKDYKGSRIVLVDPHGEYASAFPDASVYRINDSKCPLQIPFWLMNFDELAYFLVGAKSTDDTRIEYRNFRELILKYKKENCHNLIAGELDENSVTADSPIPFNIRKLWGEMNWWVNATFSSSKKDEQNSNTAQIEVAGEGDYEKLQPTKFIPYELGSKAPHKSSHQEFFAYEKKILSRLKDSKFDFLFKLDNLDGKEPGKDLNHLLCEWTQSDSRLVILDLKGVPPEVLDISVGLITRFIYDSMFWGRNENYTGKQRPILLAYEEAHSYLSKTDQNSYSKLAVEKVCKEGRKFGIGSLIISQRPSEISETILAQIGTYFALRLTNSKDQSIVKSTAPDNLNSLIDLLPNLRTGEAVVVGEAVKIPSRVRVKLNNPRPDSDDPKLKEAWAKEFTKNQDDYKTVVTRIRNQRF